jgi:hypothetical protein
MERLNTTWGAVNKQNVDVTNLTFTYRNRNARQNVNAQTANKPGENMAMLKYLGMKHTTVHLQRN